jgi:hypothetical protein
MFVFHFVTNTKYVTVLGSDRRTTGVCLDRAGVDKLICDLKRNF